MSRLPNDAASLSRRSFLLAAGAAAPGYLPRRAAGSSDGDALRIDGAGHRRVTDAAVPALRRDEPGLRVSVADSGTAAGLDRLADGRTDLLFSTRPLSGEERSTLAASDADFVGFELPLDRAAMPRPEGEWRQCLRGGRLERALIGADDVAVWSEVAPAGGNGPPPADAGDGTTADAALPGSDATVLVRGVRAYQYAAGFGGVGHYEVDAGDVRARDAVGGEPVPLVRLLFAYASAESMRRPSVESFVDRCLDVAAAVSGGAEQYRDGGGRGVAGVERRTPA